MKFWIGLLISGLFLYLALRDVAWSEVLASWRTAQVGGLVGGTLLLVGSWMISAVRWRILLAPSPGLRIRDTFAYITIGYLANTVLPLRLGDLARATLIGRNKGLGISRSLGSMAFERVLDLLTLLAITFALTLLMELPAMIQAGVASMTGLAFGALLFLVIMALNKKRLDLLTRLMSRFMPHHLAERVTTLATNFVSGVDVVHRPLRLIPVIVLSVMVWGCTGLATWVWVGAFQLAVPWFAPLFVLVVINLGSAIPSSPGYVGVYHYLAVLALSIWVPDRNAALAYAFGTHALNMLANVSLGGYFLAREGVSLRALRGA
ncbi:MAG TPA: lysylphosphatidylglycerol synthase transmembrane domain-containing protein [Kiritimatiellia bacterium]|nr:lysylphosphatidylglycerol synthase transmembrane domain-containing protein [Kiritimatiellia bacterium]